MRKLFYFILSVFTLVYCSVACADTTASSSASAEGVAVVVSKPTVITKTQQGLENNIDFPVNPQAMNVTLMQGAKLMDITIWATDVKGLQKIVVSDTTVKYKDKGGKEWEREVKHDVAESAETFRFVMDFTCWFGFTQLRIHHLTPWLCNLSRDLGDNASSYRIRIYLEEGGDGWAAGAANASPYGDMQNVVAAFFGFNSSHADPKIIVELIKIAK